VYHCPYYVPAQRSIIGVALGSFDSTMLQNVTHLDSSMNHCGSQKAIQIKHLFAQTAPQGVKVFEEY
jgi:hypothetical protein